MIKRTFIYALLLIIPAFGPFASQSQTKPLTPLKIGDKVPELFFSEILNYKMKSAKLSDLKGKLVILDFWSTWCSVCIAQFPKIESLQKRFGDSVLILPVGFEDGSKRGNIKEFIAKRENSSLPMRLPTVVVQKTTPLLDLFPFQGLPKEVWINKEGTFLGMTGHSALTEQNIRILLKGGDLALGKTPLRKELTPKSFLLYKNPENSKVFYGSAFSGYIDTVFNLLPSLVRDDLTALEIVAANCSIYDFYKYAYRDLFEKLHFSLTDKCIIREFEKSAFPKFKELPKMDNWEKELYKRQNLFCYQLILPSRSNTIESLYRRMIQDLDNAFLINSSVEQREVRCLALVRSPEDYKPYYSSRYENDTINNKVRRKKGWSSKDLAVLLSSNTRTEMLIIDEANIPEGIDISFAAGAKDLQTRKEELRKHRLELIEVVRVLPMLVLKSQQ